MYKLVIFDFDDTLLHLGVDWDAVRKDVIELAERHGIQLDTNQHLILISNSVASKPLLKKDVDSIFEKHENECIVKKSYEAFPEMVELVKALKTKGFMLGIVSGNCNTTIKHILSELGPLNLFDIICGRDCTGKNKPDPTQIRHVMEKLKVKKQETIFVGNSRFDELAAAAAGVSYFRIRNPSKDATKLKAMLSQ